MEHKVAAFHLHDYEPTDKARPPATVAAFATNVSVTICNIGVNGSRLCSLIHIQRNVCQSDKTCSDACRLDERLVPFIQLMALSNNNRLCITTST